MSAREIVALLFREIRLVMLVMIIPIGLAFVAYMLAPRSYEAAAKVLVTGRATPSGLQVNAAGDDATQSSSQEVLNSEIEILNSRTLADRTVAAVGARRLFPKLPVNGATGAPDPDAVYSAFQRALQVEAVKNANVINIDFAAPTSAIATEALSRYLELYQELHSQALSRPLAGFLNNQLNGYENDLRRVEADIGAYTDKNKLFDPALERSNLLDTRNNLATAVIQLRTHAAELTSRIAALKALQARTPENEQLYSETSDSEAVERARSQLLDLKVQATKMAANYQPGSRALQDVNDQIAAVNAFLANEAKRFTGRVRTGRNPLYDEFSAQIAQAEAQVEPEQRRAAAIDGQIAGIDQRLEQIAEGERALQPLQRERSDKAATLSTFRQREAEAALSESLDKRRIANVQVIQEATPVTVGKPSSPRLSKFLGAGLAVGLVLAAGLLGVLFALKNTFIAPESVEARTKIPVLVSLPAGAR